MWAVCLDLLAPTTSFQSPSNPLASYMGPFCEEEMEIKVQYYPIQPQEGKLWMERWFGWENERWWFGKALEHWCSGDNELILLPIIQALINVDEVQALWHGYLTSEGHATANIVFGMWGLHACYPTSKALSLFLTQMHMSYQIKPH